MRPVEANRVGPRPGLGRLRDHPAAGRQAAGAPPAGRSAIPLSGADEPHGDAEGEAPHLDAALAEGWRLPQPWPPPEAQHPPGQEALCWSAGRQRHWEGAAAGGVRGAARRKPASFD